MRGPHLNRLRAGVKLDAVHIHQGWEDRMTPLPRNGEAEPDAEPDHDDVGSCGHRTPSAQGSSPVLSGRVLGWPFAGDAQRSGGLILDEVVCPRPSSPAGAMPA